MPEEQCLEMYRILVDMLKSADYEHYEISNFALPSYHSRHNSSYWDGTPYLGLGAAAHSYDGKVRRFNPCNLKEYIRSIEAGSPAFEQERLEWWQCYDEWVMLGLRTARGVDIARLREAFGEDAWKHFISEAQRHIATGYLCLTADGRYVLTADGIMLSDSIIRDLLWDE